MSNVLKFKRPANKQFYQMVSSMSLADFKNMIENKTHIRREIKEGKLLKLVK